MKKQDLRRSMLAFSTMLGLAWASAPGASAQSTMSMQGMLPAGQRELTEEELNTNPLEIGYPVAAPGSLNIYHYMNINGKEVIMHGSAAEMRMMQKTQMDAQRRQLMMNAMNNGAMPPSTEGSLPNGQRELTQDELMTRPIEVGYPISSPGGLNLYHYMNINGRDMVMHGSASEMMMAQKKQMDAERRQLMMNAMNNGAQPPSVQGMLPNGQRELTQEELMTRPLEIGYPIAAPGSLNIYHYMNINGKEVIMHGSASEMMMMQKKQMDAERRQLMMNAMQSSGTGGSMSGGTR